MSDAKQIERDLLRELKARGVRITDLKKRQIRFGRKAARGDQ
jgi:hypothetical protein